MLIHLPRKTLPHFVDFGYLRERDGGPSRHLGRRTTRATSDFPRACLALGLPGRVAPHVAGLPLAIAEEGQRWEALLVLPAYESLAHGAERATGLHVTIQRVFLTREEELEDAPGDSTRSCAWTFDWRTWGAQGPSLLVHVAALAPPVPAAAAQGADQRLNQPRAPLVACARAEKTVGDLSPAARAIVLAALEGRTLRLGLRQCHDRESFVEAASDALTALPPNLRGHLSIAACLTRPDPAIQIAWAPEPRRDAAPHPRVRALFDRIPSDAPLSSLGELLFRETEDIGLSTGGYRGEAWFENTIVSTRDDPGIMPRAREWLAAASRVDHENVGESPIPDLGWSLSRLVQTWDPSLATALVEALGRMAPELVSVTLTRAGATDDPVVATTARSLAGVTDGPIDLMGVALAFDLAEAAGARHETHAAANVWKTRARVTLRAALSRGELIPARLLVVVVDNDTLTAEVAELVASDPSGVGRRARVAIAVGELLGPEERALAARARQRLFPRDARAALPQGAAASITLLVEALSALISDAPSEVEAPTLAKAIGERLVELGRGDLIVATLLRSAQALALPRELSPGSRISYADRRRLEVLSNLSSAALSCAALRTKPPNSWATRAD